MAITRLHHVGVHRTCPESERVQLEFIFNNTSSPEKSGVDVFCASAGRARFERQETKFSLNPKILIKSITCITYSSITEDLLKQKYLDNRLSMLDIASEFSYSKTHVRDLLLKHNIPLRKRSERYSSHCLTYGKRRAGGKIIDHKGELRTIATIKQMYADEISIAAIARFLNTMKIPTRRQGKGWDYYKVTAILNREGVYAKGREG